MFTSSFIALVDKWENDKSEEDPRFPSLTERMLYGIAFLLTCKNILTKAISSEVICVHFTIKHKKCHKYYHPVSLKWWWSFVLFFLPTVCFLCVFKKLSYMYHMWNIQWFCSCIMNFWMLLDLFLYWHIFQKKKIKTDSNVFHVSVNLSAVWWLNHKYHNKNSFLKR